MILYTFNRCVCQKRKIPLSELLDRGKFSSEWGSFRMCLQMYNKSAKIVLSIERFIILP